MKRSEANQKKFDLDIEFLKQNHTKLTTTKMSEKIGRSKQWVYYRCGLLRLPMLNQNKKTDTVESIERRLSGMAGYQFMYNRYNYDVQKCFLTKDELIIETLQKKFKFPANRVVEILDYFLPVDPNYKI